FRIAAQDFSGECVAEAMHDSGGKGQALSIDGGFVEEQREGVVSLHEGDIAVEAVMLDGDLDDGAVAVQSEFAGGIVREGRDAFCGVCGRFLLVVVAARMERRGYLREGRRRE